MIIEKLDGFTADGHGTVIGTQADLVDGDVVRVTDGASVSEHRWYAPPAPSAPSPRLLSKTQFQDYAISHLGGGVTGMGRFTDIMDATAASASSAVRFAYARYQAADTFEKTQTGVLTGIMAADTQAGHITADERTTILDNWPIA